MCCVMRHQRQLTAGTAPILDAAPCHDKACAVVLMTESGVHKSSLCHAPSCTIELGRAIGREQVLMPWGTIVSFGVGFRQPR